MSERSGKVAALALVFASAATVARFVADGDERASGGPTVAATAVPRESRPASPQADGAPSSKSPSPGDGAAAGPVDTGDALPGSEGPASSKRSVARPSAEDAASPSAATTAAARASSADDVPDSPDPRPRASGAVSEKLLTCSFEDPGPGVFKSGHLGTADGHLHVPPSAADGFTLVLHFHNGDVVRRLLAPSDPGVVLATIDAGVGSKKYAKAVDPMLPKRVLESVAHKTGHSVGKLVLTSWSAGYGAVREWLHHAPETVAAVVLLDSVHTAYAPGGELDRAGLLPFVELAKKARAGAPFVWWTHSSIVPPNFASTTEVADAILGELGGQRRYAGMDATYGVELKTRFDEGALHVRGYTGVDKGAHCAHLRMLPDILKNEVLPYLAR